jgi:hypothetical protein
LDKAFDLLRLAFRVPLITKLTPMSTKLVSQLAIISRHVWPRFIVLHGVLVPQDLAGAFFSYGSRLGDCVF